MGDNTKGFAIILTVFVLGVLILSGPAEAYILGLLIDNHNVNKGEIINFTASVEIEEQEYLNIDYLVLRLKGPMNINCKFNVDGSIISGCLGMNINQISSTPDYGYGFEQGVFSYNIILNTTDYYAGEYETEIGMIIGEDTFLKQEDNIIIKAAIKELAGCSIRAEGSNLIAENQGFDAGKVSFYMPLGNADNGKGSLIAQKGRSKFSYKYDITQILENNDNYARILIAGKYKIDKEDEKNENSIIFFDKINNKISLEGDNVNIDDTNIIFRKKC